MAESDRSQDQSSALIGRVPQAAPGALVCAPPGPGPAVRPSDWEPAGSPAFLAESREHLHPVLHYAGYIGRVGLLAAVLGVGEAMFGASGSASASPAGGSTTTSTDSGTPATGRTAREHTPSGPVVQHSGGAHGNTIAEKPSRSVSARIVSESATRTTLPDLQPADEVPPSARPTSVVGYQTSSAATSPEWVSVANSPTRTPGRLTRITAMRLPPAPPYDAGYNGQAGDTVTAAAVSALKATGGATATSATDVVVQAETMVLNPTRTGSAYNDSTASGGKALLMSTNGSASATMALPDSTKLVIRAKGDQYKGAPTMTVSVDGKVVSTIAVSATTWTDYTVPVAMPAGTHTVSIAYTNDLRASASKDRNLRLDRITVVSAVVTPPGTETPAYFPAADWLWKPIGSNPALAANSATWVSYLSAPNQKHVTNLYQYGVTLIPASSITASTPRYDVRMTKPWGSDPFGSYTVAIPAGTRIPPGSDGQIAVLDPVTGQAFGIWQARYDSSTNTWSGSWGGMTPINGNGVDRSGLATATGISRYAGVVTAAEFQTAVAANTGLNHALVFSTDIAGPGFVGPAIKSDGTNMAGVATPIPEGYRIQLDPSIDVDAIPGITPGEKVIAKTLQTYGAYVVDQGGARMAFSFETVPDATSTNPGSAYTSAGFSWDYYDMAHIPWGSLRVLAA